MTEYTKDSIKCADALAYFISLSQEIIFTEDCGAARYYVFHSWKTGTDTACYTINGKTAVVMLHNNAYITVELTHRTQKYNSLCENLLKRHVLNAVYRFINPYLH